MSNRKVLHFRMEPQEQSAWCWAAVAVSTAMYYDPNTTWDSQCKVATACLGPLGVLPPHVDTCCGAPWDANLPVALGYALTLTGTNGNGGLHRKSMTFDEIVTAIDDGHPVAVAINFSGSETPHFVVIKGYSRIGEKKYYAIADPAGHGNVHYHDADQFLNNYLGLQSTWGESVVTKGGGQYGSTT